MVTAVNSIDNYNNESNIFATFLTVNAVYLTLTAVDLEGPCQQLFPLVYIIRLYL